MPGIFGDNTHWQAMVEIGPTEKLLGVDLGLGEMGTEVFPQGVEMGRRHGGVIVPPDGVFGRLVADGELVLGRAAGVLAGFDHQRAATGDARAGLDSGFIQPGFVPIGVDGLRAHPQIR